MNYDEISIKEHLKHKGKWETKSKFPLTTKEDLSIAYTPGVAAVCQLIAKDISKAYDLTMKANTVAIVSDGSAVLGLGNIGPEAAIPVMEGKALLFKEFAGIDGVPIVLNQHSVDEIVATVKAIAPTFSGINLEDIKAPQCFKIEEKLQDIGIPVFHDDQHGTAIVLLAALINAAKLKNTTFNKLKIVVNGAGSAGIAIVKLLKCINYNNNICTSVGELIVVDSKGIISKDRTDLNDSKKEILSFTNCSNISGDLRTAIKDADVFIGVSKGNLLKAEDIKTMAKDPVIFAMANPTPEICPADAYEGGAFIVGTGRSDLPNQINNVLVFPGLFKGAIEAKAPRITPEMKIAAAYALANSVKDISTTNIIPSPFDKSIAIKVADAVKKAAIK